ncbi:PhoU domain-containing protein [Candidatus Accumulibacter sp. ACC012]|uniref:phosphate signaling complex PhoU family protein n=1 Tax=Candidatus Accumulibacter sp. ACC012 TaxID=2823332 RepID=UPI0025C6B525|nr:PhoU domain-containing protein [Candidatus Accumulibacter sp. ACC012]
MSHYEERLERDLSLIKQQATLLAKRVDAALAAAVRALLSGDDKLAYATVLGDQRINAENRKLDKMCHAFIGVHLPSAGHLRLMTAMIHANVALERVGDYAVTIARESVHLAKRPDALIKREVELLAGESRQMFKQAMCGFIDGNAEKARATMIMADQGRAHFDVGFCRPGQCGRELQHRGSLCLPGRFQFARTGVGSGQEHLRGNGVCGHRPDQGGQGFPDPLP